MHLAYQKILSFSSLSHNFNSRSFLVIKIHTQLLISPLIYVHVRFAKRDYTTFKFSPNLIFRQNKFPSNGNICWIRTKTLCFKFTPQNFQSPQSPSDWCNSFRCDKEYALLFTVHDRVSDAFPPVSVGINLWRPWWKKCANRWEADRSISRSTLTLLILLSPREQVSDHLIQSKMYKLLDTVQYNLHFHR